MIEIGKPAPDFEAIDSECNTRKLSGFFGDKKIILVFYRGDWCPVCNVQLHGFVTDFEKFQNLDSQIIAISVDNPVAEQKFKEKLDAPFVFLSDPGHQIIDLYCVFEKGGWSGRIHRKNNYSKPAVFIIDKNGLIQFKYVGNSFSDRPKNSELLKILEKI